jgi:hypothetical protein
MVIGIFSVNAYPKFQSYRQKRSDVISFMEETIKQEAEVGNYRCCIDPPCKMCFLGNWIWEDGKCDCDTMIIQDKMDKVCPECLRGIKEGKCTSTKISRGTCPILKEDD